NPLLGQQCAEILTLNVSEPAWQPNWAPLKKLLMNDTLIHACEMFLLPGDNIIVAFGVAPTERLKALISAAGVLKTRFGRFIYCSGSGFDDRGLCYRPDSFSQIRHCMGERGISACTIFAIRPRTTLDSARRSAQLSSAQLNSAVSHRQSAANLDAAF